MKIKIYSLEKTVFEGEGEKLIVKTSAGEITVLDGHLPIVSNILNAPIKVIDKEGRVQEFPCDSGFLEVQPENNVVILLSPKP